VVIQQGEVKSEEVRVGHTIEDVIQSDLDVMSGKPVVRGTRITVELILEKVAAGESIEQIQSEHPHLTIEQIRVALEYIMSPGNRTG
jgi:uncharacterized protein (DUF433 family)